MKKLLSIILSSIMLLSLTSCTKADAAWKEQFDRGVRYLSELEFESAVQSFNEAIRIDPKQASAYIGLAQTYTAYGDKERARDVIDRAKENIGETEEITNAEEEIENSKPIPVPYVEEREIKETVNKPEVDGTTHVYNYDAEGRIMKYTWCDKNGNVKYYYEFDGNGNKIKKVRDSNEIVYEYDENNNLVREFNYFSGKLSFYTIYTYDEDNNLIFTHSYDKNGGIGTTYLYEYDANGNKIKYTAIRADNSILSAVTYEYDQNGNCTRSIEKDGCYTIYEYDGNGNNIEQTFYATNGNRATTRWEYNEKNQCVKEIEYSGFYSIYEYDENGDRCSGTRYEPNGKLNCRYTYRYDSNHTYIHMTQKYEVDEYVSSF